MKDFLNLMLIIFLCLSMSLHAQNTQVIKGTILDKQSEEPLIGAAVELLAGKGSLGAVTDIDGYFRLENVPIGRQGIRITYLGYEPVTLPNIVVTAGKEVILDIALEESVENLDEVVVKAETQKDQAQNELATISARTFSVEEVNRYSGGRSDVARLASNFAGVATSNDSRNDIVIRGNSPTGLLWRLEGIPIPNPNHFSTLGTTGGPVSALNPNILKNSDFLTSAFPAEYGDALSGVFDLGFRSGNRDRNEYMFQVGAVSGLELMAEGPMNKRNNGSFLIAGRYSFIALGSQLGLDIGTSALPNYQDIAMKLDFGNGKAGKFTLFGVGGTSDIEFLGTDTDEDDLFAAPDEDAFPKSRFGVVGLRHNIIVGDGGYIRTVISGSLSQNRFELDRYFNLGTPQESKVRYAEADNTVNRYSFSTFYNKKFSAKWTMRTGVLGEMFDYNISTLDAEMGPDSNDDGINELITVFDFNDQTFLIQPFAQSQYRFNNNWTLNLGVHTQYLTFNETFAVEPRFALNWDFASSQKLSLGYGLHHQSQPLNILVLETIDLEGNRILPNEDLGFTRSHHFVLGYDLKFASDWRAKVETYYQALQNAPVESTPSSFSMLNTGADFVFPDDKFFLVNEGTGSNLGLELTIEKFFSRGYYGLLTASVFDSKYEGSDGIERNTAFNNGYVFNILAGKEWKIGKAKRNAFTLDTKVTTAGGRYYTPVNLEASREAGFEVLFDDLAFSERQEAYFRWDIKFGIQINSPTKKLSHRFYFDIQNVTNNENIFVQRYNRQTNEVNEIFQIGFFPDFMYRVQF